MKRNLDFFAVVTALLVASAVVLAGCMAAIVSGTQPAKPYDLDAMPNLSIKPGTETQPDTIGPDLPAPEDGPVSAAQMKEKFASMSSTNIITNTITVITENYLEDYWRSNYDRERIRSLTADEVFYLVQDTIDLYCSGKYSRIVLPGYAPDTMDEAVAQRFPSLQARVIECTPKNPAAYCKDIYEILLHRIALLSSPKAYRSNGEQDFYIPGYREEDNAAWENYLPVSGQGSYDYVSDYFEFEDLDRFSGSRGIVSCTKDGGESIYPTRELQGKFTQSLNTGDPEDCSFNLDLISGEFTMGYLSLNSVYGGSFIRADNMLVLRMGSGIGQTLLLRREEDHFVSLSRLPELHLEKGMVFHAQNAEFWEELPSDSAVLPMEYTPGSVLLDHPRADMTVVNRKFRQSYYAMNWCPSLSEEEKKDLDAWLIQYSEDTNYGQDQNEMLLVTFIKRYNIPREIMEQTLKACIRGGMYSTGLPQYEGNELPNLDIIYTFDNEIINNYYRYEIREEFYEPHALISCSTATDLEPATPYYLCLDRINVYFRIFYNGKFRSEGSYQREGEKLRLTTWGKDEEKTYIFRWEDGKLISESDEPSLGMKKGMVLYRMSEEFWEALSRDTPMN